jgi:hypothetical protein
MWRIFAIESLKIREIREGQQKISLGARGNGGQNVLVCRFLELICNA